MNSFRFSNVNFHQIRFDICVLKDSLHLVIITRNLPLIFLEGISALPWNESWWQFLEIAVGVNVFYIGSINNIGCAATIRDIIVHIYVHVLRNRS